MPKSQWFLLTENTLWSGPISSPLTSTPHLPDLILVDQTEPQPTPEHQLQHNRYWLVLAPDESSAETHWQAEVWQWNECSPHGQHLGATVESIVPAPPDLLRAQITPPAHSHGLRAAETYLDTHWR